MLYDYIGFFGPFILSLWNLYSLQDSELIYDYVIFYIITICSNIILKNVIKDPRPLNESSLFIASRMSIDEYGMPSGHAQTVWYNAGIILLGNQSYYVKIISLTIACLTIIQRYMYNNHTFEQLLIGTLLGCITSYIVFMKHGYKYTSPI